MTDYDKLQENRVKLQSSVKDLESKLVIMKEKVKEADEALAKIPSYDPRYESIKAINEAIHELAKLCQLEVGRSIESSKKADREAQDALSKVH